MRLGVKTELIEYDAVFASDMKQFVLGDHDSSATVDAAPEIPRGTSTKHRRNFTAH